MIKLNFLILQKEKLTQRGIRTLWSHSKLEPMLDLNSDLCSSFSALHA